MFRQWEFLVMWVVWWRGVFASCPEECTCSLDSKGRTGVFCLSGNMTSIPVGQMDLTTEVVIISAPEDFQNFLTIGPIFTQPNPFVQLQELHIVYSNVPAIGQFSLWGLKNLKVLNLTHNNISAIVDNNFRGLVSLNELYLDHNRIDEMPSETFRHLYELRYLSLEDNNISGLVPRLFRMLGKLIELNLSGNPITDLEPEVFRDVQSLKVLKCRRCKLSYINTHIYNLLANLDYFDIGENDFRFLLSDHFRDLKKLQVLKFDGNDLPVIQDNTFASQHLLKNLTYARNRLSLIPPLAFANLTQLRYLDISYNKLEKLNALAFQPLGENLQILDVSGNSFNMDNFTKVLEYLTNLTVLKMENLNLVALPAQLFAQNKNLRSLSLMRNKFMSIPVEALNEVPHLVEVDFSHNALSGLNDKALQRFGEIAKVNLADNLWDCSSCGIHEMVLYKEKPPFNTTLGNLICRDPRHFEGLPLKALTLQDVPPPCDHDGNKRLGIGEDGRRIIAPVAFVVVIGIWLILCTSKPSIAEYFSDENKAEPEAENPRTVVVLDDDEDVSYGMPVPDATFAMVTEDRHGVATVDSTVRSMAYDI